eukprot:GHVS01013356.1.p1 GENE.GHVS01013356.1~~GHVS01013356.1.p1  ORF type:complete len:1733 (-),score=316.77 GHVS01013356.1:277-5448(-)
MHSLCLLVVVLLSTVCSSYTLCGFAFAPCSSFPQRCTTSCGARRYSLSFPFSPSSSLPSDAPQRSPPLPSRPPPSLSHLSALSSFLPRGLLALLEAPTAPAPSPLLRRCSPAVPPPPSCPSSSPYAPPKLISVALKAPPGAPLISSLLSASYPLLRCSSASHTPPPHSPSVASTSTPLAGGGSAGYSSTGTSPSGQGVCGGDGGGGGRGEGGCQEDFGDSEKAGQPKQVRKNPTNCLAADWWHLHDKRYLFSECMFALHTIAVSTLIRSLTSAIVFHPSPPDDTDVPFPAHLTMPLPAVAIVLQALCSITKAYPHYAANHLVPEALPCLLSLLQLPLLHASVLMDILTPLEGQQPSVYRSLHTWWYSNRATRTPGMAGGDGTIVVDSAEGVSSLCGHALKILISAATASPMARQAMQPVRPILGRLAALHSRRPQKAIAVWNEGASEDHLVQQQEGREQKKVGRDEPAGEYGSRGVEETNEQVKHMSKGSSDLGLEEVGESSTTGEPIKRAIAVQDAAETEKRTNTNLAGGEETVVVQDEGVAPYAGTKESKGVIGRDYCEGGDQGDQTAVGADEYGGSSSKAVLEGEQRMSLLAGDLLKLLNSTETGKGEEQEERWGRPDERGKMGWRGFVASIANPLVRQMTKVLCLLLPLRTSVRDNTVGIPGSVQDRPRCGGRSVGSCATEHDSKGAQRRGGKTCDASGELIWAPMTRGEDGRLVTMDIMRELCGATRLVEGHSCGGDGAETVRRGCRNGEESARNEEDECGHGRKEDPAAIDGPVSDTLCLNLREPESPHGWWKGTECREGREEAEESGRWIVAEAERLAGGRWRVRHEVDVGGGMSDAVEQIGVKLLLKGLQMRSLTEENAGEKRPPEETKGYREEGGVWGRLCNWWWRRRVVEAKRKREGMIGRVEKSNLQLRQLASIHLRALRLLYVMTERNPSRMLSYLLTDATPTKMRNHASDDTNYHPPENSFLSDLIRIAEVPYVYYYYHYYHARRYIHRFTLPWTRSFPPLPPRYCRYTMAALVEAQRWALGLLNKVCMSSDAAIRMLQQPWYTGDVERVLSVVANNSFPNLPPLSSCSNPGNRVTPTLAAASHLPSSPATANKLSALLGIRPWRPRVAGQRGLRLLCLDGGGSRGVVSIGVLRQLQAVVGHRPLHQLFDVVCGTSTGGIIAMLVGMEKMEVRELEGIYDALIRHVFHPPHKARGAEAAGDAAAAATAFVSPPTTAAGASKQPPGGMREEVKMDTGNAEDGSIKAVIPENIPSSDTNTSCGSSVPEVNGRRMSSSLLSSLNSSITGSLSAVGRLISRQAFYDERCLETMLASSLGDKKMIDSAADPTVPKVFCLSTKLSSVPSRLVLWRNYNYPPPHVGNTTSSYVESASLVQLPTPPSPSTSSLNVPSPSPRPPEGSFRALCADALRAATAAPLFFAPLDRHDDTAPPRPSTPVLPAPPLFPPLVAKHHPAKIPSAWPGGFPSNSLSTSSERAFRPASTKRKVFEHAPSPAAAEARATYGDGALLANNPAGVALSEARRLFAGVPVECVVSVGTGQCRPTPAGSRPGGWVNGSPASGLGWGGLVSQVVNSATTTEGVHSILNTLLPPSVYYRFNPDIDFCAIDETRPAKLTILKEASRAYFDNNSVYRRRLMQLADVLRPSTSGSPFLQSNISHSGPSYLSLFNLVGPPTTFGDIGGLRGFEEALHIDSAHPDVPRRQPDEHESLPRTM